MPGRRYAEIKEDILGECANMGTVRSLNIPRPSDNKPEALGKVFVEYEDVESATKAAAELGGRVFAGRTVIASYHDPARYAEGDLA